MSGMEAEKVTIPTSKFNATVKNSKKATQPITLALTYLQHFDQIIVEHFTYFDTEKQQK